MPARGATARIRTGDGSSDAAPESAKARQTVRMVLVGGVPRADRTPQRSPKSTSTAPDRGHLDTSGGFLPLDFSVLSQSRYVIDQRPQATSTTRGATVSRRTFLRDCGLDDGDGRALARADERRLRIWELYSAAAISCTQHGHHIFGARHPRRRRRSLDVRTLLHGRRASTAATARESQDSLRHTEWYRLGNRSR